MVRMADVVRRAAVGHTGARGWGCQVEGEIRARCGAEKRGGKGGVSNVVPPLEIMMSPFVKREEAKSTKKEASSSSSMTGWYGRG